MKYNNKNNKTVIRSEKVAGKFTTVQHRIIKDKRLSTDARLLLISILSDADDFDLSRTGQMNRLGISEHKFGKAMNELVKYGYVKKTKTYGQYFHYTISEYGNLKKEDETLNKVVVTTNKIIQSSENDIDYLSSDRYNKDKSIMLKDFAQYNNYLNMQFFEEKFSNVNTRDDFFEFRLELEKDIKNNKRQHFKFLEGFINQWPVRPELKNKTLKEVRRLITDEHKKPSTDEVKRIRIKIGRDKYKNKVKRYGYDLETRMVDRYENPLD